MKTAIQKLKEKLEKLCKAYIRKRDDCICQRCQKPVDGPNCHCSHVIPVSFSKRMSFILINMKVLCYHCHINWWHKHPTESGEWFRNKFPDRMKALDEMKIDPNLRRPIKEAELLETIEEVKQLLENL